MNTGGGTHKERNWTAWALFGAAAIQGLLGYVGWSMNRLAFGWFEWLFSLSGVIFLGLGIAARWRTGWPALIAATLYAAFLAWQLLHSVAALKSGVIFKIPVAALMLVALATALRRVQKSAGLPKIRKPE